MDAESQPSLARLAAIVQWSADAIVTSDLNHIITSWNPAAERLLGYTAEEAIGRSFELTVPTEHIEKRRQRLASLKPETAIEGIETYRVRKDGSRVDVEVTVSSLQDADSNMIGYTSILRDISERKASEKRLRELEFRFRTFFEHLPALTYIHAANGQAADGLLNYSPRFEEVIGYPLEQWLADPYFLHQVVHPDDREQLIENDRRATATGKPFSIEFRLIAQDGRVLWLRDQATLVRDEDGKPLYWLGFMLDIGEQKAAEAATVEALARLAKTNWELEQLSNAKSDFVSMISHEFRTPLTSIQGFSELIATEAQTLDEARSFAITINESAMRLARMVSDVLDLDRLEAGQTELRLREANLNQLVDRVISSLRTTTHRHSFVPQLDPALPTIQCDADLVTRVVTNLVANAIKYSPDGGPVTVTTAPASEYVELTVADHGLGIPVEHREAIFARYGRISRPEQVGIEGTGLGLPIARRIVDLHGGMIWVEGNRPTGSIFHVTLPTHGPA